MFSAYLFQAGTDPVGGVASAGSEFLKQGWMGGLCLILMGALAWVTKAMLKSKDDRVSDAKEFAKSLREINDASTALLVETNRSNDALKGALGQLQSCQQEQKAEFARLREEATKAILLSGKDKG